MKVYIVPSSLFVAGRIMQPLWIARDIETLQKTKARNEAELASLPGRIEANKKAIAEAEERLSQFDQWRVK